MRKEDHPFKITAEDKIRYEELISAIDLATRENILRRIPGKITQLLSEKDISPFLRELIEDVSKLYTVIKNVPNLDDNIQKRILFALQYFNESDDEIPDNVPEVGYLDDAVLVHWIAEQTLEEFSHIFEA